jgi:hypothetical protein
MPARPFPDLSIEAFEAGAIDAGAFDHEAHVYVAWLYLERYALAKAIGRFTSALRRLTQQLGVPDKYHETISWFFLLVIAERREARPGDWAAFRQANEDLFGTASGILRRYYSDAVLFSERARCRFVLPDRLAA